MYYHPLDPESDQHDECFIVPILQNRKLRLKEMYGVTQPGLLVRPGFRPRQAGVLVPVPDKTPPALSQVNNLCVSYFVTCLAHFPGRLCSLISGILFRLWLTGSAVPGILQARTLEWVAISFSNA